MEGEAQRFSHEQSFMQGVITYARDLARPRWRCKAEPIAYPIDALVMRDLLAEAALHIRKSEAGV